MFAAEVQVYRQSLRNRPGVKVCKVLGVVYRGQHTVGSLLYEIIVAFTETSNAAWWFVSKWLWCWAATIGSLLLTTSRCRWRASQTNGACAQQFTVSLSQKRQFWRVTNARLWCLVCELVVVVGTLSTVWHTNGRLAKGTELALLCPVDFGWLS